ncbi:dihydrolipoyl dehydrogenase [Haliangium sp.]|uniref:dihydrolipoyl dehydrogenase n=1 Tax=Haliangium sp. TaxID=2663208 RepID=UPI003D10F2A5
MTTNAATPDITVDVAILGAGTAGSHAASQVRRAGKRFVLINGGPMGTTCARVGCMPSKMLIQAADLLHERALFDELGIRGGDGLSADIPAVLRRVRWLRDELVEGTTNGIMRKVDESQFMAGYARFVAPDVVEVEGRRVRAERFVIATGSRPVVPAAWRDFGERVFTTDELFEREDLPARIAVVGLGAIGLEMGQAMRRLGVEVTGFDALDHIGGLVDPAVDDVAQELIGREFPMYLGAPAEIEEVAGGLRVSSGDRAVIVDAVLASIGRRPNLDQLGLDAVGAPMDERGLPVIDPETMRVGDLPVYVAGDATGDLAIMHEAADEGRIAGHNVGHDQAAGASFCRKTPLAIVFTDPNIATVGARWDQLDPDATAVGEFDFSHQTRARVMGKARGRLRLYGERASGRLLGAAMCAPSGEHLAHLLAWSIQQQMTVSDVQKMPYYHPTLEEGLAAAIDALARQVARTPGPLPHVRSHTSPRA